MKPILFNTEMVRAILDGRKTVTRRVMKPQPILDGVFWTLGGAAWTDGVASFAPLPFHSLYNKMPYKPGDILYVRETWGYNRDMWLYKEDYNKDEWDLFRWHPSIHMPKEAARLFLRVTDVRVERLQDITEEQARAEGVSAMMVSVDPVDAPDNERTWHEWGPALPNFIDLWDSTIPKDKLPRYGWEANPWVWVIGFERISKEEAQKGGDKK